MTGNNRKVFLVVIVETQSFIFTLFELKSRAGVYLIFGAHHAPADIVAIGAADTDYPRFSYIHIHLLRA
jgi:hypothetical protein